MPEENSVLFALRDLRSIEADRVAEERRAAEQLRQEQERVRAAEAERRRNELQQHLQLEAEHAQHAQDRVARTAATSLSEQLEADLRVLRSMAPASAPKGQGPHWLWFVMVGIAAVAILGAPLFAWQHVIVQPRAIELPRPELPIETLVTTLPKAPTLVPEPPTPKPIKLRKPTARSEKKAVRRVVPTTVPNCDDNDPLCGAGLE